MAGEEHIPRWGVELSKEVTGMQATLDTHLKEDEQKWRDNRQTHTDLYQRVDRPSWAVTVMLSLLTGTTVGLAVFAVSHIK